MPETEKICNMCGAHFDFFDNQSNFSFTKKIGYGSKYDCSYINLNLCCRCFDTIMQYIENNSLISPIKDGDVL